MAASGANEDLSNILAQLPRHRDSVAALYAENEELRTLCEDHALACAALKVAEAGGRPEDSIRAEEYRCLILELLQAIGDIVETARPHRTDETTTGED